MGTWGPQLYEDDLAVDIKVTFEELVASGKNIKDATRILINEYADSIADVDDAPIFWFALADLQSDMGCLLSNVRNKAIEHLNNGRDLNRWIEESPKHAKTREKVLKHLEKKLNMKTSKPRKKKTQITKKTSFKFGDIISIPLPNGKSAFARVFKECSIAVYQGFYSNVNELPFTEEYRFIVYIHSDLLTDGKWKVVGHRPFENKEDAWTPRQCIKDVIRGQYSLYYKGQIIPSTEEECKGLEQVAVWDRHHVVDRIMGETKWNII